MESRSRYGEAFSLRAVAVCPGAVAGITLMAVHHYLPHQRLFSKCLRHIALPWTQCLALVGWQVEPSRSRRVTTGLAGRRYSDAGVCI